MDPPSGILQRDTTNCRTLPRSQTRCTLNPKSYKPHDLSPELPSVDFTKFQGLGFGCLRVCGSGRLGFSQSLVCVGPDAFRCLEHQSPDSRDLHSPSQEALNAIVTVQQAAVVVDDKSDRAIETSNDVRLAMRSMRNQLKLGLKDLNI